jgi:hypothetical protein
VQASAGRGNAEGVVSRLLLAVPLIVEQQERCGEKDLFRLSCGNVMTLVLASVSIVPVELGNFR